jgi:hypothetical protein
MLYKVARAHDRAASAVCAATQAIDLALREISRIRDTNSPESIQPHLVSIRAVGDALDKAGSQIERIGQVFKLWRLRAFASRNLAEASCAAAGWQPLDAECTFVPLDAPPSGWPAYASMRAYIADLGLQLHDRLKQACDSQHGGAWDLLSPCCDGAASICPDLGATYVTWWEELRCECEAQYQRYDAAADLIQSRLRADIEVWWNDKLLQLS